MRIETEIRTNPAHIKCCTKIRESVPGPVGRERESGEEAGETEAEHANSPNDRNTTS